MDIFSARVKWLREKRGLTQKEAAELVGMSPQGYGKVENGQREPNLEKLAKFPEVFGESVDFMLGVHNITKEIESVLEDIKMVSKGIERSAEMIEKLKDENEQEYRKTNLDIYNLSITMVRRFEERLHELESEIPKG